MWVKNYCYALRNFPEKRRSQWNQCRVFMGLKLGSVTLKELPRWGIYGKNDEVIVWGSNRSRGSVRSTRGLGPTMTARG